MITGDPDDALSQAGYLMSVRLRTLERRLREAAHLYSVEQHQEGWDHGRLAAEMALNAVIDFLTSDDQFRRDLLAVPLLQLVTALCDLDHGRQHPMLTPARPPHRPGASLLDERLKGYAAAIMTALMKAGRTKREAANRVAVALAKAGYRLPGVRRKVPTANTVAGWRDRVIGAHEGGQVADAYSALLTSIEQNPSPLEVAAGKALEVLTANLRQGGNLLIPPA